MKLLLPAVALSLIVASSSAFAKDPVCAPFVRAVEVEHQGFNVAPKGDLVLLNPSYDRPGDAHDPWVIGARVIPLNEAVDDQLSSLPPSGTLCLKGTQSSSDTFFAYVATPK